jgi:hypothetical protein
MDAPDTCGKGLAAHATFPAKLADVIGALADNLALHQHTLDRSDPAARAEYDVYVGLEQQYRDVVTRLTSIADHMDAARNLPMGKHLADRLADPALFEVFARFVKLEEELLELLEQDLERDRVMLAASR